MMMRKINRKPRWAVRVDSLKRRRRNQLIGYARERVDQRFRITGHGEMGEPANGTLLLWLAREIEQKP